MSPGTENREYADRMAWADDEIVIEQEPPPDDGPQVEQYAGLISSQLLDLAGGWHDAWEHERRAPDGRWVKGASGITIPPEGLPFLRNQVKAAQDKADADGRMDVYSYLGNASRLMDRMNQPDWPSKAANWIMMAADRSREYGDKVAYYGLKKIAHDTSIIPAGPVAPDSAQAVATELTSKASTIVPDLLGGGHLAWDRKPVTLYPAEDDPYILAGSDWDGHISMQREYAQALADAVNNPGAEVSNPDAFSVIDHELIHLDIPEGQPDRSERDKRAYQQREYADIEEGFTELGSIQHAPEFFDRMGIGKCKTPMSAALGKNSPRWDRAKDELLVQMDEVRKEITSELEGPHDRASWQSAIDELGRAMGDLNFLEDISSAKHAAIVVKSLGTPANAARGARLQAMVNEMIKMPMADHLTMSEYARRLQDPARIKSGDAWGHYADQTGWAEQWVEMIAQQEGHTGKNPKPGSKMWDRMVELADEINREGTAKKPDAMARQLYPVLMKTAEGKNDPKVRAAVMRVIRASILRSWATGLDPVSMVMKEARTSVAEVAAA